MKKKIIYCSLNAIRQKLASQNKDFIIVIMRLVCNDRNNAMGNWRKYV